MQRGLMYRRQIPKDTGMLFIFPSLNNSLAPSFTMENTPVSLDMIFLDKEGIIVDIIDCAEPFSKGPFISKAPNIKFVIEAVCGTAYHLDIGAQIKLYFMHF